MASSLIMPSLLITMVNNCGSGYGNTILTSLGGSANTELATGNGSYLATGSLQANAFYDNGLCTKVGGNCSTVHIDFSGDTSAIAVASSPTYGFSAPFGFSYYTGSCDSGYWCSDLSCISDPSPVNCTFDGQAGVVILFCPSGPLNTTFPSTSSARSSPASSSIGAIIGGIVGGVILLTSIALVFFLAWRRKRIIINEDRNKIEFRPRSWDRTGIGMGKRFRHRLQTPDIDPPESIQEHTPRSGSPAGRSVAEEMPVQVVYSDTSMPFKELPTDTVKV